MYNQDFVNLYGTTSLECSDSPLNSVGVDRTGINRFRSLRNGKWIYGVGCNGADGFTIQDVKVYGFDGSRSTVTCGNNLIGNLGDEVEGIQGSGIIFGFKNRYAIKIVALFTLWISYVFGLA
jgi:hypothetical protein